jgi:hypothetical protein
LRQNGAASGGSLYLAIVFLPAFPGPWPYLQRRLFTTNHLQTTKQPFQRATKFSRPIRSQLARGTLFMCNRHGRESTDGRRFDCLYAITLSLLKRAISA